MEFVRDKGTFIWNLAFPAFLVLGLAFAFSGGDDKLYKVGVIDGAGTASTSPAHASDASDLAAPPLLSMDQMQIIPYADADAALSKLGRHQLDLVVDLDRKEYSYNPESTKSRLVRELFTAQMSAADAPGGAPGGFVERSVSGKGIRYVDWLVPGVIGMNIMFSSLSGVGFVIVRYRKNGVLKRFKASPVGPGTFVAAQAASRLAIALITSIAVFVGTNLVLKFVILGSPLLLLLIAALGILCMISIGLVFAARLRSEELASGLINIVTFPMLALSGVFFSLEGSPPILTTLSRALPLTHFIEASRKVMLDGAGLAQIAPNLAVLAGITAIAFALSAWLFKWE